MMVHPKHSLNSLKQKPNPLKTWKYNTNTNNLPLRIAFINVRGLKGKKDAIMDMMKYNKINILGILETKLNECDEKFLYHNDRKQYKSYFTSGSDKTLGLGTRLLIDRKYNAYVHKHKGYKGRIYHVDMLMKNHTKLHIIQTYINANHTEKEQILDLFEYIISLIEDCKKNHSEIIIMGDFNISFQEYFKDFTSNKWIYKLFRYFKRNHLLDTLTLYNDEFEKLYTFYPGDRMKQPSRLDYIWMTVRICKDILNSKIVNIEHFNINHRMITIAIDPQSLFGKQTNAKLR